VNPLGHYGLKVEIHLSGDFESILGRLIKAALTPVMPIPNDFQAQQLARRLLGAGSFGLVREQKKGAER
jgi:hypothetical protein